MPRSKDRDILKVLLSQNCFLEGWYGGSWSGWPQAPRHHLHTEHAPAAEHWSLKRAFLGLEVILKTFSVYLPFLMYCFINGLHSTFFKIGVYILLIMPPHSYLEDFNLAWHTCSKGFFQNIYTYIWLYIFDIYNLSKLSIWSFVTSSIVLNQNQNYWYYYYYLIIYLVFSGHKKVFSLKKISEHNFSISIKSFKTRPIFNSLSSCLRIHPMEIMRGSKNTYFQQCFLTGKKHIPWKPKCPKIEDWLRKWWFCL